MADIDDERVVRAALAGFNDDDLPDDQAREAFNALPEYDRDAIFALTRRILAAGDSDVLDTIAHDPTPAEVGAALVAWQEEHEPREAGDKFDAEGCAIRGVRRIMGDFLAARLDQAHNALPREPASAPSRAPGGLTAALLDEYVEAVLVFEACAGHLTEMRGRGSSDAFYARLTRAQARHHRDTLRARLLAPASPVTATGQGDEREARMRRYAEAQERYQQGRPAFSATPAAPAPATDESEG